MKDLTDRYLEAMAAHDPSRLPLAKSIRLTENTVPLAIGDGLWSTTISIGSGRQYFADITAQQAGFMGVIFERDGPKMLALRLRIKNKTITEIEMVTARPGSSDPMGNNLANWKPRPIWQRKPLPSERMSRDALAQAANQYFEAIEKDRRGVAKWSDDCTIMGNREANGSGANVVDPKAPAPPPEFAGFAKMPCDNMFGAGILGGLNIPERSFWIVDEEMGDVLGAFIFSMDKPFLPTPGQSPMGGAVQQQPNAGIIAEAFKVLDGKIYELDAVTGMTYAYGTRTGW